MIRRAPGVTVAGAWCFVGGAIEPGETQAQAVVREFREEVGGRVRPLEHIWEYDHPDGTLRLHWWRVEVLDEALAPNPDEVAEVRWCTVAEILALPRLLQSNRAFLRAMGDVL
jgi:mutator protein MutT